MTKHPIKTIFRQRTNFRMILPFIFFLSIAANSFAQKGKTDKVLENMGDWIIIGKDTVYITVDKQPEFIGYPLKNTSWNTYVKECLAYPPVAKMNGIQGRVITRFIVEKDGHISNVEVIRGIDPSLDKEAVRLLKSMPNWMPGKQNGKTVRVQCVVPISFQLDEDNTSKSINKRENPDKDKEQKKISESDEIYTEVDKQPEFPGGEEARRKYLDEKTVYPLKVERINGLENRIIVNFVVERDGSITDVRVVRGVDPSLDKEAVRIIENMSKWIPGERNGEIVRVRYTLPVLFRIQFEN